MNRRPGLAGILVTTALLAYPLFVYFLWQRTSSIGLAVVPLALMVARAFLGKGSGLGVVGVLAAGAFAYAALFALRPADAVLYYPVVVNATLCATFAITLVRPPSLVETIASQVGMEMTPEGVIYTRGVTLAWTLFFAANAVVCVLIAKFATIQIWGLYNGLISHVLAASFFAIEYHYRRHYRRRVHGLEDAES